MAGQNDSLAGLSAPLTIDEVKFRIQSINKNGVAVVVPYTSSKVCMNRLDKVVGPLNWRRVHYRDNSNCVVSLWNSDIGDWVGKEDTGTESNTEAEKGLAADSFKRACVNWGIGRELSNYPTIRIQLLEHEYNVIERNNRQRGIAAYGLLFDQWLWHSQFDPEGNLSFLAAKDYEARSRYKFGNFVREAADE